MQVFDVTAKANQTTNSMFFDGGVSIARYDQLRYPFIDQLNEKQMGFLWRPQEIDLSRESADFKALLPHEQHIFTSNLKRQILLDSVQGRAPSAAFGPVVSLPELENWIQTWTFSEQVHSRSYTHIIRNVYSDPSVIFDTMLDIQEIIDCAKDVSSSYDRLIEMNFLNQAEDARLTDEYDEYDHKEALWLALMSVNILEGIRFYVSFACSWAFAEQKKTMEGNAKIIKLICRDENLHLAGTQYILKALVEEDPDFKEIAERTRDRCIQLFLSAAEQEKQWARYLFKDGSMLGLNEIILSEYVEWITNRRLQAVGLPVQFKSRSNPLPWTEKWISGNEIQTAPQETAIVAYTIGAIKQDVTKDTLKKLSLR